MEAACPALPPSTAATVKHVPAAEIGALTKKVVDEVSTADWLSLPTRFWILSFDASPSEFISFLKQHDKAMYDFVRANYREYLHVRRLVKATTESVMRSKPATKPAIIKKHGAQRRKEIRKNEGRYRPSKYAGRLKSPLSP